MPTTQNSRILIKRSTTSGEVPTVPVSNDHTDGSWLDTDIYKGEIFINLADSKVWTRTDAGIKEIPFYSAVVDDTAYNSTTWNGVTNVAPSKNAVRDMEQLLLPLDGSRLMTGSITFADSRGVFWDANNFLNHTNGVVTTLKSDNLLLKIQNTVWDIEINAAGDLDLLADNITSNADMIFANTKGLAWGSGSFIKDAAGGITINANDFVTIEAPNGLLVDASTISFLNAATVIYSFGTMFYVGATGIDGTWRFGRSSGNFVFEKRVAGSYVNMLTI